MTNIIQIDQDLKYSFLKVRKEKESFILGINPTNKYQHEILKMVKNQNTIQNAGKGLLFSVNNSFLEQLQLEEKLVVTNLNQLMYNQFLTQVLVFEYDNFNNILNIVPYFITHPSEEKTYSIYMMFDELMVYSYNAVKAFFDSRPVISREEFLSELNFRFSKSEPFRGATNLFNPLHRLEQFQNGISTNQELIEYEARELTRRITEAKLAIEIPNLGLFMVKSSEIQTVFETSDEFINSTILPPILEDFHLRGRFDDLILNKKTYYETEEFPKKTAKFSAEIAREIRSVKTGDNPKNNYQGAIAVESVIKLESQIEEIYNSGWNENCDGVKRDFKRKITTPTNRWQQLITFIEQPDTLKFPPNVWKELLGDQEMFYIKWQTSKSTVHVFTGKDQNIFKSLIIGIISIPDSELWKAQALKFLIEKYEKQLKSLLNDTNFSTVYKELEKKVYLPYIPWFIKILLFLPFPALFDTVYQNARSKIKEEQDFLAAKNDAMSAKINAEIAKNKKEMFNKIKEEFICESIIRTLDNYYITQKIVPSLGEIKNYYPDNEIFESVLKKKKFRILSVMQKNGEAYETLLYPEDSNWLQKKSSIVRSLDTVVSNKNPHISMTMDKSKIDLAVNFINLLNEKNNQ
jgi:hypothetical protein